MANTTTTQSSYRQMAAQIDTPDNNRGNIGAAKSAAAKSAAATSDEATSDEDWRARLTPEQYRVTRMAGTERPYTTGNHNEETRSGLYHCVCCGEALFNSQNKFDSGTGWPSFYQPANGPAVTTKIDFKLVMPRTEVRCTACGSHMGHVFKDGPAPTGLRYCINGTALDFRPDPITA